MGFGVIMVPLLSLNGSIVTQRISCYPPAPYQLAILIMLVAIEDSAATFHIPFSSMGCSASIAPTSCPPSSLRLSSRAKKLLAEASSMSLDVDMHQLHLKAHNDQSLDQLLMNLPPSHSFEELLENVDTIYTDVFYAAHVKDIDYDYRMVSLMNTRNRLFTIAGHGHCSRPLK